jgi:hypothetical protein
VTAFDFSMEFFEKSFQNFFFKNSCWKMVDWQKSKSRKPWSDFFPTGENLKVFLGGRLFNSKLGRIGILHRMCAAYVRHILELKAQPKFRLLSGNLNARKFPKKVLAKNAKSSLGHRDPRLG